MDAKAAPTVWGEIVEQLDQTTFVSLAAVALMLGNSYMLSRKVLDKQTPSPLRILFVWHAFDFLVHATLEGSFLYNCFFTSETFSPTSHSPALLTGFAGFSGLVARVLGNAPVDASRVFGAAHGDNWATGLWMVYAKADRRWGEADLTVISLELLTVLCGAPLALYICWGISQKDYRVAFWMIVLATGELYGGFMTFAPEWLSGNPNLDGSNFMFMWVYLVFFNMLWVVFPLYAMYVSFVDIGNAFTVRNGVMAARIKHLKQEIEKSEEEIATPKSSQKGGNKKSK